MVKRIDPPFVVPGPAGVAIRTRLKGLTAADEAMLRQVGAHLGNLASADLKARCAAGPRHDKHAWAARKRALTAASSARWAGSITKTSNDQWALARRNQLAHLRELQAAVATIRHRLSLPVGEKGTRRAPGGYRSAREYFAKSRRLRVLEDRLARVRADWDVGRVRVVRGGRRLARTRHHLDEAELTEEQWRARWQAARLFLSADGESGKRHGNETVRITPGGQLSIRLPAPLAHLANAPHSRYVLAAQALFNHRGQEWADRVAADRAVAYTITYDPGRGRWYVTAAWQPAPAPVLPVEAALVAGCVAVDTNDDHLACWRLDEHGNPVGNPRRFFYDLSGNTGHRDAQIRHALTRLLHHARDCGVQAIAVEDLNFEREKIREKHGRRKRFRQLISRFPTARLRARLVAMAAEVGIAVVAVDPAYTSKWGAEHWQKPLTTKRRDVTRHDAAAVAIGRRALGLAIRRRTAPPPHHRSDGAGHRTVQTGPQAVGREGTRPPRAGPRTRCVPPEPTPPHQPVVAGANTGDQRAQHRSGHAAEHESRAQDSLPLSR